MKTCSTEISDLLCAMNLKLVWLFIKLKGCISSPQNVLYHFSGVGEGVGVGFGGFKVTGGANGDCSKGVCICSGCGCVMFVLYCLTY